MANKTIKMISENAFLWITIFKRNSTLIRDRGEHYFWDLLIFNNSSLLLNQELKVSKHLITRIVNNNLNNLLMSFIHNLF